MNIEFTDEEKELMRALAKCSDLERVIYGEDHVPTPAYAEVVDKVVVRAFRRSLGK